MSGKRKDCLSLLIQPPSMIRLQQNKITFPPTLQRSSFRFSSNHKSIAKYPYHSAISSSHVFAVYALFLILATLTNKNA